MMNDATRQFIHDHRLEDVRQLALKGKGAAEVDMPFALRQIAGWQTARTKLPSWAAVDGIIYPPHLNMEQCSSEATARYKASLVSRDFENSKSPQVFLDLTGGFGVDFSLMSRPCSQRIYVERDPVLCEIARHNFQMLGLEAEVVCDDAASYLTAMSHADVIFLDPARRDDHGGRTYDIKDCTPNVIELLPLLKEKAGTIILKLSPMLDWHKAVEDLGGVSEVHIVSVDNECKELLLVVSSVPPLEGEESMAVHCVNLQSKEKDQYFSFSYGRACPPPSKVEVTDGTSFLFEPNASIMKAGCFQVLAHQYEVQQAAVHSHLFLSDHDVSDFPGRRFRVEVMTTMNKQELRKALTGIEKANIAVRNFPMTAETLRKKLKLKDGGDMFIFGTTLSDATHLLFICRKIG